MIRLKFKKRGWAAVPVIAAILAWGYLRACFADSLLDEKQLEVVKEYLRAEYLRRALPDLSRAVKARDRAAAERLAAQNEKLKRLTLTSVGLRGNRSNAIVRVEVQVDGKPPPDGQAVRYLRMEHNLATGWYVKWPTSAFLYYVRLY